jgi:hypothetical protein
MLKQRRRKGRLMPDVFISYARSDRKRVAVIAEALEAEGYSLWWEALIRPGKAEQEMLRQQLLSAHSVIVCWSRTSAKSDSVLTEANQGYNQQKLVPITLQACDPPMPFNMVPSADLTLWKGEADDEYWIDTLAEIRQLVERGRSLSAPVPPPPVAPAPAPPPPPPPRKTALPEPRQAAMAREEAPRESSARAPRYKGAARNRRKSGKGAGGLIFGAITLVAVLAGAVWAGPKAFHYIANKLSNPQQAESSDPAATAPYVMEITPTHEFVSAEPPSAAPVLTPVSKAAPAKPSVQPKPAPVSVKAPSAAPPPPSIAVPPKAMASMEDMEACLRQVARACDVSTSEFRTDGQFSAGERRLMGSALFPDGAQPTETNLAACKTGSTRRAINSEQGKALCAALRQPPPPPAVSAPAAGIIATRPVATPSVSPNR